MFIRSTRRFSDVLWTEVDSNEKHYASSLRQQWDEELGGRSEMLPRLRSDMIDIQGEGKAVEERPSEEEAVAMGFREPVAEWILYPLALTIKDTQSGCHWLLG